MSSDPDILLIQQLLADLRHTPDPLKAVKDAMMNNFVEEGFFDKAGRSGAMIWSQRRLGSTPQSKHKAVAPNNSWSAMSANQQNRALYGGWSVVGKGLVANAPSTSQLSPLSFATGNKFRAMLGRLDQSSPGTGLVRDIYDMFRSRGLRPNVAIHGFPFQAGRSGRPLNRYGAQRVKRPSVTFSVGGPSGPELMSIPFEMDQGLISHGGRLASGRTYVMADGTELGASEYMRRRMKFIRTSKAEDIPRKFRSLIREMREGKMLSTENYMGYEMESRSRFHADSVVFSPQHQISKDLAELMVKQRAIQLSSQNKNIQGKFQAFGQELEAFYSKVEDLGYTLDGIKQETLFSGDESAPQAIAFKRQDFYAGLFAGKMEKGIHQLFQRHDLSPGMIKRAGFERHLPWVMATGQEHNYEAPIRLGYVRRRAANMLLGDSDTIIGSKRLLDLAANFPDRQTKTISVATSIGVDAVGEVDRRFAPWVQDLLKDPEVMKGLEEDLSYTFKKPMGMTKRRGKGRKLLLGVSTAKIGSGAVVEGETVTLDRGYGIKAIRATPTSAGMQYDFITSRPRGTFSLARFGALIGGTTRVASHRAIHIPGIDLLARRQEVFKSRQTQQTNLSAYWFSLAEKRGLDTDKLAGYLGLRRVRNRWGGRAVYEGGNSWKIDSFRGVRKWFYKELGIGGKGDETARREFNKIFLGERVKLDDKTVRALVKSVNLYDRKTGRFTSEGQDLYNLLMSDRNIRVLDGAPIAIRSGMGAGVGGKSGFRMRLDHYQAMIERVGIDPNTDPIYKAHADLILRKIKRRSPTLTQEARNLLEPIIGPHQGPAAPVIGIGEYKTKYAPLPNLRGGVDLASVADTALGKDAGVYVELPGTIRLYGGNVEQLARGGEELFFRTNRIWIPSSQMLDFGRSKRGAYYSNPVIREFRKLDRLLRGNPKDNMKAIEMQYNNLHFAIRKGLLGKKGKLVPTVRIKNSWGGKLGYLGPGADQALDIGMTEATFRRKYGRGAQKAIDKMNRGGDIFVSGAVDPTSFSAHYMPALRVRLMKAEEMVPLAKQLGNITNMDDVLLLGDAAVTIGERDFDFDTFRAMIFKSTKRQERIGKMWANDEQYFRWANEMAKKDLATIPGAQNIQLTDALPQKAGTKLTNATRWANYARTKYGTPVPELFFRNRRRLVSALAHESTDQLAAMGMERLIGKGITPQHMAAYDATVHMIQQQFLGKSRSQLAAFGAMNSILAFGSKQGSLKKVKKAVRIALRQVVNDKKFRAAWLAGDVGLDALRAHGVDPRNLNELIDWMADKVTDVTRIMEPEIGESGYIDPFYSTFRGVSPYKTPGAMARDLGTAGGAVGEKAEELGLEMYDRLQRSGIIPKNIKYQEAIAYENKLAAIPAAADKAGNLGKMWGEGIANTVSEAVQAIGRGVSKAWQSGGWGKAAIVGGGVLLAKVMLDAFSGGDTIAQPEGGMPPASALPFAGQDYPRFGMDGPPIGLARIGGGGGYRASGTENPQFADIQQAMMGQMVDTPGGYGYMINDNLPEDEFSMESYISSKMRSDF